MTTLDQPLARRAGITAKQTLLSLVQTADETAPARWALVAVAGLAALLYVWNLTVSDYANIYYSAAAQAAAQSWSAWFFGSVDPANFITVDKPPLATMVMGLSVRLLGLSSWSILLPQALAGVGTVAVLFLAVRRSFGTVAATIAGLVTALTPAAVLIFRYNNPDALLTFLLVTAAWALGRGLENGRLRWPVTAAVLAGLAFLTKYLQAYLVLPAFAAVWLVAAPGSLRRRIAGLLASGLAVVVASGWWVAIVELIPAANRPFIGGSTTNSVLDLILGYDGLGRLFGRTGPGPGVGAGGALGGAGGALGGPGGGGGFSGGPGLLRLFNDQFGGQIGWLIPLALVGLVAGLWLRGRAARTDRRRAGYLLWGLWFLTTGVVFSLMSGIIHSYYVVALAPAVAALVGAGVVDLWKLRSRHLVGGLILAATLAASGWWSWQLLERTPGFAPGLGVLVLALTAAAAILIAVPAASSASRWPAIAAGLAIVMLLAGPAAYALETTATAYSGGDPSAGPASVTGNRFGGPGRGGTHGGPGDQVAADDALIAYLVANRGNATWVVAARSSQSAGSIQLASGLPVMAMGGFSGGDPAPTLDQLKSYVASGQLRFVLVGARGGGPGGDASAIDTWVTQNCTPVAIGGATTSLYDCAGAVG